MTFWDCQLADFRAVIERAGFKKVSVSEKMIDFTGTGFKGPMYSLAPHIYGYAVK